MNSADDDFLGSSVIKSFIKSVNRAGLFTDPYRNPFCRDVVSGSVTVLDANLSVGKESTYDVFVMCQ